jgi:hypothetical protein
VGGVGGPPLGFHESRHRRDLVAYLESHPLPTAPEPKVDMSASDYKDQIAQFQADIAAYKDAANADTDAKTDEVGRRTRSEAATRGCYVHKLR